MKKISIFFVGVLLCSLLVGCGNVQNLTDDETKVIAEYAADLLLKYDISYNDRIREGESDLNEQEETSEEALTQTPTTEETATTETTEQPQSEPAKDHTGDSDGSQTDAAVVSDLSDVLGLKDISVTYKDYLITNQYPATDEEGKFIYLEASPGYQLLVVRFEVGNATLEPKDISLIDKDVSYKILCNGNKAAKPMLTILMDDLSTLETTLDAGDKQDAVLVFQISDDLKDKIETIQLYTEYDGANCVVDIQ